MRRQKIVIPGKEKEMLCSVKMLSRSALYLLLLIGFGSFSLKLVVVMNLAGGTSTVSTVSTVSTSSTSGSSITMTLGSS